MYTAPEPLRSLVEDLCRDATACIKDASKGEDWWVNNVEVRTRLGYLNMVNVSAPVVFSIIITGDLFLGSVVLISAYMRLGYPARVVLARRGTPMLISSWGMAEAIEELEKILRVEVVKIVQVRELEETAELFLKNADTQVRR